MSSRLAGKVAFVTGAELGQGRSHAIRLTQEGANVIAVDLGADVELVPYSVAAESDLGETVRHLESPDRRMVALKADICDLTSPLAPDRARYITGTVLPTNAGATVK
jgi:(+)-trans-carveol dehydrogenase